MAFRDLLVGVEKIGTETSVIHGIMNGSKQMNHRPLVFSNLKEAPNHSAALNVLTRKRICETFNVSPGELIDILAWAMNNPCEPEIVDSSLAPVMENTMAEVDLEKIPIPWHYPEDRGRYQSASVIIAQYNGIRNMSFHRQFLRDGKHTVSRFVPRHLRTMTDQAANDGKNVDIAVVNGADAVVLLAAAMSFTVNLDELTVAAALHKKLHGKPLKLVELANGIQVPANAEYAMQAKITLERDDEGPYVDITGTVDDVRQENVIQYNSIHHRNNPVFHALIPGEVEHLSLIHI